MQLHTYWRSIFLSLQKCVHSTWYNDLNRLLSWVWSKNSIFILTSKSAVIQANKADAFSLLYYKFSESDVKNANKIQNKRPRIRESDLSLWLRVLRDVISSTGRIRWFGLDSDRVGSGFQITMDPDPRQSIQKVHSKLFIRTNND